MACRVKRAAQTFMLPLHLSSELAPSAVFYGTLVPVVSYVVVRKLVVDPYMRKREIDESKRKQLKLKSELAEKRRLALVAVRV